MKKHLRLDGEECLTWTRSHEKALWNKLDSRNVSGLFSMSSPDRIRIHQAWRIDKHGV